MTRPDDPAGRTATAPLLMAAGLSLVALLGAACQKKPPEPSLADVQAARLAALSLDIQLRQDILSRLDRDEDPVAVYVAYRDHVGEMTQAIEARDGLTLSRVALRVRNPTNRPNDWEATQLEKFQASVEMGFDPGELEVAAIVTEDGKRVFRWMKPLLAEDACLTCHGDQISPRILALLKQDYAEDDATGYYAFEMLGAYSVSKPLD
jgi:hypothetical protein